MKSVRFQLWKGMHVPAAVNFQFNEHDKCVVCVSGVDLCFVYF